MFWQVAILEGSPMNTQCLNTSYDIILKFAIRPRTYMTIQEVSVNLFARCHFTVNCRCFVRLLLFFSASTAPPENYTESQLATVILQVWH